MNLINKLICLVLGHKWVDKIHDQYCTRCGISRPKPNRGY